MKKETFKIVKMDCPSEEQLITMKLAPYREVRKLQFDIPNRTLFVYHVGRTSDIEKAISELNLGSKLERSETSNEVFNEIDETIDRKLLWVVLYINAAFFIIEVIAGFIANSMGLVADSLDMLADAIVYGLSIAAVGSTIVRKKRIARMSGYFQMALAIFGLVEVIRRFLGGEGMPNYLTMIYVALFALIGNAVSLYLLQKKKSKEVHMEASYIFTSNDVVVNIGVIVAGIIVNIGKTPYPDLIIGTLVFLLVAKGAVRILKLAK